MSAPSIPVEPRPPAAPADAMRYVTLDGLRGVAAILVVLHHYSLTWYENRYLFGMAPLAVDFFFCLSGFVIAHAYEGRLHTGMAIPEYFVRRLIRLYPMYALGGLLGLGAIIALKMRGLTDFTWMGIWEAAVMHMLYIPNDTSAVEQLFSNTVKGALFPLNNPAWSLFFELLCANLVYAFVARYAQRAALLISLISALALVAAAAHYGSTPGWGMANVLGGLPRVLYAFFAGVVIYQHRHKLDAMPKVPAWLLVGAVLSLFGLPRPSYYSSYWLWSAMIAVPVLVALAMNATVTGSTQRRLAEYSGRISYPIYCIHYPILMLCAAFAWRPQTYGVALTLFVATTLVVSHVLLVAVDEPLRAWLVKRRQRSIQP